MKYGGCSTNYCYVPFLNVHPLTLQNHQVHSDFLLFLTLNYGNQQLDNCSQSVYKFTHTHLGGT